MKYERLIHVQVSTNAKVYLKVIRVLLSRVRKEAISSVENYPGNRYENL